MTLSKDTGNSLYTVSTLSPHNLDTLSTYYLDTLHIQSAQSGHNHSISLDTLSTHNLDFKHSGHFLHIVWKLCPHSLHTLPSYSPNLSTQFEHFLYIQLATLAIQSGPHFKHLDSLAMLSMNFLNTVCTHSTHIHDALRTHINTIHTI